MISKETIDRCMADGFEVISIENQEKFEVKFNELKEKYEEDEKAGAFFIMLSVVKKTFPETFKTLKETPKNEAAGFLYVIAVGWESRNLYQLFLDNLK